MQFANTLSLLLCCLLLSSTAVSAQTEDDDDTDTTLTESARDARRQGMKMRFGSGESPLRPVHRWYKSQAFDMAILSTAVMERPGTRRELTTLRFSMLNFGNHFNYDFDDHFGIFSGLILKNIGFIEKNGDSTTKRRLYTLGMPLGFKLGNLQKRHYGFIGGGVDFPINYREKRFINRGDKYKFNEFFSDRTDDYMPYIFAGVSYGGGMVLKMQYYPGNFFNTGFEEDNNGDRVQPYRGYRVNLLYLSLGLDLHYKTHEKTAPEPDEAPPEM